MLDVGGGSGAWAVPLARLGCAVTVVDSSPNALAALQRRARESGVHDLVTPVQGDVDALAEVAPPDAADLVLGHGLVEVVDDPGRAVAALRAAAAPGAACRCWSPDGTRPCSPARWPDAWPRPAPC